VDLACGTGFVILTLGTNLTSNDRLVALDLGEAPLKSTSRNWEHFRNQCRGGPALVRLAGDAQTIPLADASADLVAMNASLHHIPDPWKVLGEVDRILRPGGFFALGFEPNRSHFESAVLAGLARGLARLQWYASPCQNRRRLRAWIGWHTDNRTENEPSDWTAVAEAMNSQLLREGLVDRPLSTSRLLDLIDPHARGDNKGNGFNPGELLRQAMPDYQTLLLLTSDYLGETARLCPTIRAITDAALRAFAPGQGSLFSWLVRKPIGSPEVAP
jgi:SAM-dependent methyltransferase